MGKKKLIGIIVTTIIIGNFILLPLFTIDIKGITPFFSLKIAAIKGGVRPDYCNLMKQQLAQIGIGIDFIFYNWMTWSYFYWYLQSTCDMFYVGLSGGGADPDFTGVYDENGSLNMFGYHTSMDWDDALGTGLNEWYMKQGTLIMPPNSEERIQHYWEWEQYLMDKICPVIPTFTPLDYMTYWSTLEGYSFSQGLLQSWGKMYWSDSHKNQEDITEVVIADALWSDLNPLFQDDSSSNFISNAVMDPLIWYDDDLSVWPHLAKRVEYINDTTIEIEIREGIKWQSDPDEIYTNEYLDIKDVYFTFHSWRHISKNSWYWIKDMEIVDQYTMRIYVDGDPSTPENDVYAPSLPALATRILPEHFLNQTQLGDGVTPDPLHPSWNTFSKAAFGTGLFEINNFNQGVETKLRINNESWWLNEDITIDPYLNWKNRFGNFNNGLEQLRVRIIPNHFEAITIFQNGGIDIISLRNYPEIRKELLRDEKFTIQSKLLPYMGFFGFNMREIRDIIGSREPCPNDPEITIGLAVRKAISYAINKIEMNNIIHEGDFFITDWPIYPSMGIWCNPNIIRYNFDLELAKKYMAKAGFIIETPITNQYNSIASFFREWWPVLLGITIGVPVVVFSSVGLVKFSKYLNKRILLKKQKHNDKLEN